MNIFEVLKSGIEILEKNNIADSDFDARCLLEEAFSFSSNDYFLNKFSTADEDKTEKFMSFIERRASGEPLQYIIGKWPFMSGEFFVGKGVLIPRSDTEVLVESAADFIRSHTEVKTVYDLCAGSGCVGISIAMMFPDIDVYCFELSDIAFSYLEKNIELNKVKNVTAVKGDILQGYEKLSDKQIDVLVSNPPYIETDEISTLSREVREEPVMALDGGKDGYVFYNSMKENWIPFMKKGSFAAFECGEMQAQMLKEIFSEYSEKTEILKDLNDIERVVSIVRN